MPLPNSILFLYLEATTSLILVFITFIFLLCRCMYNIVLHVFELYRNSNTLTVSFCNLLSLPSGLIGVIQIHNFYY